ncbi:MAG TPA: single-stranded DNA-binding protein [Candidatus Dormibacteraeota bacterium]|nr:single-stranded DNA-binding protein [Candidatus Dormibacteraeota bacterium]
MWSGKGLDRWAGSVDRPSSAVVGAAGWRVLLRLQRSCNSNGSVNGAYAWARTGLSRSANGVCSASHRLAVAVVRGAPAWWQSGWQSRREFDLVLWGRQAEVCSQYAGKGSLVAVEGRLSSEWYEP